MVQNSEIISIDNFLQQYPLPLSELNLTKMIKKTNVFDEILGGNKANLNAAMITLLKVNLAHLQIVITFYGHTLAGGYLICQRDIMVHPDCSFVSTNNE